MQRAIKATLRIMDLRSTAGRVGQMWCSLTTRFRSMATLPLQWALTFSPTRLTPRLSKWSTRSVTRRTTMASCESSCTIHPSRMWLFITTRSTIKSHVACQHKLTDPLRQLSVGLCGCWNTPHSAARSLCETSGSGSGSGSGVGNCRNHRWRDSPPWTQQPRSASGPQGQAQGASGRRRRRVLAAALFRSAPPCGGFVRARQCEGTAEMP